MAYTIQAIIVSGRPSEDSLPSGAKLIELSQGMYLVPLGEALIDELGIPFLPFTDEGPAEVPSEIEKACSKLSAGKSVAYIEAEFFGGEGTQASIVWKDGAILQKLIVSPSAINLSLKCLGVEVGSARDEFEALQLGRHRDTAAWLL